MATILLADPNELLGGKDVRGLTGHDDEKAEAIKHSWWRAHNMDKVLPYPSPLPPPPYAENIFFQPQPLF